MSTLQIGVLIVNLIIIALILRAPPPSSPYHTRDRCPHCDTPLREKTYCHRCWERL